MADKLAVEKHHFCKGEIAMHGGKFHWHAVHNEGGMTKLAKLDCKLAKLERKITRRWLRNVLQGWWEYSIDYYRTTV